MQVEESVEADRPQPEGDADDSQERTALAGTALVNRIDEELSCDPTCVAEETSELRRAAIDRIFHLDGGRAAREYLTVADWPCAPFPVLVHTTFHHFDLFLEMYTTITMNDACLAVGDADIPGRDPSCGDWRCMDAHAIGKPVAGLLPNMDLEACVEALVAFVADEISFTRIVLASLE